MMQTFIRFVRTSNEALYVERNRQCQPPKVMAKARTRNPNNVTKAKVNLPAVKVKEVRQRHLRQSEKTHL